MSRLFTALRLQRCRLGIVISLFGVAAVSVPVVISGVPAYAGNPQHGASRPRTPSPVRAAAARLERQLAAWRQDDGYELVTSMSDVAERMRRSRHRNITLRATNERGDETYEFNLLENHSGGFVILYPAESMWANMDRETGQFTIPRDTEFPGINADELRNLHILT
jgi:hypothetical protein